MSDSPISKRFPLAAHRLRVLEALGMLTVTKLVLRVLPFSTVIRFAGSSLTDGGAEAINRQKSNPVAIAIGVAVKRASHRLPWQSKCLVQALAGQWMLKRRGVSSILMFGVAKSPEEIEAHAWLIAGGVTVCGGRQAPHFQPIAAFGYGESPERRIKEGRP